MRHEDIARRVARLHAQSWKSAYRGIFPDAYLDAEVETDRLHHWRRRVPELATGQGEILLATVGDRDAGFLCIQIGPGRKWGAFVDNLHVLPRMRGSGIGVALLEAGADWARAHGQSRLYLWVFEKNHAARRFYEREGWHAAGRERHAIPSGERLPVWRMVKDL